MPKEGRNRVCPVERAGSLDTRIRRLIQNPRKLLQPFIREGMTVLDLGCGPGFFTLDMAILTGETGRVIAADLQQGMLDIVEKKIKNTELKQRITLHLCGKDAVGVTDRIEFALLFYLVHEVPDKAAFFKELSGILNPGGKMLMVEPPFHVSKPEFAQTLDLAVRAGFSHSPGPRMWFQKSAVLVKR